MLWVTGGDGDGASGYDSSQTTRMFGAVFGNGYLEGYLNEMAVSGTSSPISVATGAHWINGIFYHNDAAKSLTISTPGSGSTGFRVVVRADWSGTAEEAGTPPLHPATNQYEARVIMLTNAPGTAAIPVATQTLGDVWDETLATGTITSAGVIALTDARTKCVPNINIPASRAENRTRKFFLPAMYLEMGSGLNQATETLLRYDYMGYVRTCSIADSRFDAVAMFAVPDDFASGLTVTVVVANAGTTKNIKAGILASYGTLAENYLWTMSHANQNTPTSVTLDSGMREILSTSLSSAAKGDMVNCAFNRDSSNVEDTADTVNIYFFGFLVSYTADS